MEKPTESEAYEILEQLHIPYQRVDHAPITSVKNYVGQLPGPQVKNLLLKTKKKDHYFLVILPDPKIVDLKELAVELGTKRLSFASPEELDELIGLPPGSVSPLAVHHDREGKIQVIIDESIDREDTVGFHPNINTTTLIIPFPEFERFLDWASHPPLYRKIASI